jgi:hypothetical protein
MTVCHNMDQVGIKPFHIIIVLKLSRWVLMKDPKAQTHTALPLKKIS